MHLLMQQNGDPNPNKTPPPLPDKQYGPVTKHRTKPQRKVLTKQRANGLELGLGVRIRVRVRVEWGGGGRPNKQ
jgi:hypothetical protein